MAFIDEVFKANSAILNTLLTILNERLFDNGRERVPVPLVTMVAASNEMPESEELDALYDRFLLRCSVKQVRRLWQLQMSTAVQLQSWQQKQALAVWRAGRRSCTSHAPGG